VNGQTLDFLYKLQSEGKRVKLLEGQPELYPDLEPIWNVFQVLDRARACSFSPQPLKISEIIFFLEFKKVEDVNEGLYLIQAMDQERLNHYANS
jgi:hypothetical protein